MSKFNAILRAKSSKSLLPAGKGGHQGHGDKHKDISDQRRAFESYIASQEDALFAAKPKDDDLSILDSHDKLESKKGPKNESPRKQRKVYRS